MHRQILPGLGTPAPVAEALAAGQPVPDARLRAMTDFVEKTLRSHGAVSDDALDAFVAAGYTPRHALEVVVGIATYTLTTFANRMTRSETLR